MDHSAPISASVGAAERTAEQMNSVSGKRDVLQKGWKKKVRYPQQGKAVIDPRRLGGKAAKAIGKRML